MAKQSINTLKNWFKRGLKPLEAQFADWIDSFWHKDETIPMNKVEDLVDTLNTLGAIDQANIIYKDGTRAMEADFNMGGNRIKNAALSQEDGDVVVHEQLQAAYDGTKNLIAVRAASTGANLVLSGEQTIDGVACVDGDYVFPKDQTDPTERLPHIVRVGAWEVVPEIATGIDVQQALVQVGAEGTANQGTHWQSVSGVVELGVTALVWINPNTGVPNATAATPGKMKKYSSTGVNTDGTMTQQAITDALDLKLDALDYNDRFKGKFTSLANLEAAFPVASVGDSAQVDEGPGFDVINYNWDEDDGWIEGGSGSAAVNTDALPEGSTNLYFTSARVRAVALTGLSLATNAAITAADTVLSAFGKLQKQITDLLARTTNTNTGDETATSVGTLINSAAAKATPVDADQLGLMDSAAANVLKKLSWANLKATLKTYFDTLYGSINAPTNLQWVIDGGGAAIAPGRSGIYVIPFDCVPVGWTLLADVSGSIQLDIWLDTYANYPPTVADTIAGTEKPLISGAIKNQNLALATWAPTLTKGRILKWYVDSASTLTQVTVEIRVTRA